MSPFADYPATTPHLGLPMLFVGQAQKEFFVNQSLAVIDALAGQSVVGEAASPPASPAEGSCYRIAHDATGAWVGRDHQLALAIGGDWHYITPRTGSLVFDQALGQFVHFDGVWQTASVPSAVVGGAVVDAEARALLAHVIDALAKLGLVAAQPV
ncbi:MAG: DUF2793 domain-containing protein [Erythrobacter sp.]